MHATLPLVGEGGAQVPIGNGSIRHSASPFMVVVQKSATYRTLVGRFYRAVGVLLFDPHKVNSSAPSIGRFFKGREGCALVDLDVVVAVLDEKKKPPSAAGSSSPILATFVTATRPRSWDCSS